MLRTVLYLISAFIIWNNLTACNRTEGKEKAQLPYYNTPDFTPIWIDSKDANIKVTHKIDPFAFTDQNGKTFTSSMLDGKLHVANFFFSSCGSICPKMTENFSKIQKRFRDNSDVKLVSFSVTPWIDSVPRLKLFAKRNHVEYGKWFLLTGSKADIYNTARKSYFAEEDMGFQKDSTEFLHTEHFILVDKSGRLRGIYNGTLALETQRLMEDIDLLVKGE